MRHLTINEYGTFIGCSAGCVQVKNNGAVILEAPLSRLRTISIAKEGVSFSSDLIYACSNRGIRLFFLDWRNITVANVSGCHQHAVVMLRKAQFEFLKNPISRVTAAGMIYGKIRNQRATLLYFNKYQLKKANDVGLMILSNAEKLANIAANIKEIKWERHDSWREEIMGYEGAAASIYWDTLKKSGLLPNSFLNREGRGSNEVTNQLLNYGYTLLTSYVWSALDNAGFELYAGLLHVDRPGKPSLVLDFMEEYRAWVVDANVIKMRSKIEDVNELNFRLKNHLSDAIHTTMSKLFPYRQKKMKLETIIQRQAYRLAASIVEGKRYQPYRFNW